MAGLEIKEHTAGNAEAIRIARHGDLQLGKGIDAVVQGELAATHQIQADVRIADVPADMRVIPRPAPA